mmetsp:Transcript_2898/g.18120  ORF Transcript_2898/g.18120 Transcript_2898/m.18120 type:complete len:209 (-) Transcript_2898:5956-6582(-)
MRWNGRHAERCREEDPRSTQRRTVLVGSCGRRAGRKPKHAHQVLRTADPRNCDQNQMEHHPRTTTRRSQELHLQPYHQVVQLRSECKERTLAAGETKRRPGSNPQTGLAATMAHLHTRHRGGSQDQRSPLRKRDGDPQTPFRRSVRFLQGRTHPGKNEAAENVTEPGVRANSRALCVCAHGKLSTHLTEVYAGNPPSISELDPYWVHL